ncbi:MAG: hypothetical protein A2Y67_01745 [Candidatus Buchananbacteria bacterium RBG_13_39_9]|uniref:PilZ domain-containing protein n=1 Tax=Candidatus Buchananbacteria bacterium RBG_13_39_9 TaxID=1797531 RepID=A0A1G1XRJ6_9BACT|nr:MAG: hypothetical protein A2Y67_01745 [Candidatus Buchananbacteria bacterium RBG_13_39_9]
MKKNKESGGKQSSAPADRRQDLRKVVPDNKSFPVVIGQPSDSTYLFTREIQRKKPPDTMFARLLSAQEANCTIENISEQGLCICSSVNLEKGQQVGVYLRIPPGNAQGENGITLICAVIWHKPWAGMEGVGHQSGLNIIHNTDQQSYKKFVANLPPLETAHA